MGLAVWLVLALLWIPFVVTTPSFAETSAAEPAKKTDGPVVTDTEKPQGTVGIAAYYAKRHHGKRTHSGAIHHRQRLTAAHPTLPHGTRVKVINLANNRSVIVTINDRCRNRKGEFIDLSRAAARQLGFLGQGKARVRIIPLDEE
jgi:rare lipoprotein A